MAPPPSNPHPPLNIFQTPRVKVRTTWPKLPMTPGAERPTIRTARMLLRAPRASDVEAMYEMRKDPDVMRYTARGLPDDSIEGSHALLARYLPPKDAVTYYFTVVYLGENGGLAEDAGVVIGSCGAAIPLDQPGFWFGWPELGYSIRKSYWGKGLATELMRGWLDAWWALPREPIELKVHPATLEASGDAVGKSDGAAAAAAVACPERLTGLVGVQNGASLRVLEKVEFTKFLEWEEIDNRPGLEGNLADVAGVMASKPSSCDDSQT